MSLRAAGVDCLARVRPSTPLICSLVILLAAISLAGPQAARAADDASNIIKKMNSLYTNARSFEGTVNVHNSGKSPRDGKTFTVTSVQHLRYKSPNLIQANVTTSGTGAAAQFVQGGGIIVSDGHNMYQYASKQKEYVKRPMLPRLTLLQVLNVPNLGAAVTRVVGSTSVNGHSAYQIEAKFKMPALPANMPPQQKAQIEKQLAKPIHLVIDKQNGQLLHMSAETMMGTTSIDYTSQAFNVPIPASAFVFTPPPGAKERHMPVPSGPGGPGAPPPGLPPGGRRP